MDVVGREKTPPVRVQNCRFSPSLGSGIISLPLAKLIKRARNLSEVPSVCQIRLEVEVKLQDGKKKIVVCKGIVLTDFSLEGKAGREELHEIRLRKSMMKLTVGVWCDIF